MRKLMNLYRLNFGNAVKLNTYLLKRIFRLKPTKAESALNEYYNELIRHDGFLKSETESAYVAFFPKWKATVKTRKQPSSDLYVFGQVFRDLEYKPVVEAYLKNFSSNRPLAIVDAGGNIGLTSLYLSRSFPNARFICIEPDPDNFQTLEFNMLNNDVNAKTLMAGLWSKNARLELVNDFRDKRDWSVRVQETESGGIEAFSVNHLMAEFSLDIIDILKIDVEGSEKEIFTAAGADTSFLSKTKCIAIEIHDEFDCREAIYSVLHNYGFDYFEAGELTIGINRNLVETVAT